MLIVAFAFVAWGGLLASVIDNEGGIPASRDVLVPLLLAALLAASVTSRTRMRRLVVGIALDWLPFVLALWLYDLIRGIADGLWLPVHYGRQMQIDRLIGFGTVPSVWLQQHLWRGQGNVQWYDYASWLVYMSYFFGTTLVLVFLWWRSRALFWRFAASVVGLAFLGCATFVLYPAEPPWMVADQGLLPPLARIVQVMNGHLPGVSLQPLWEQGTAYANDVAAMPSLHASYTLLISLFFFRRLRGRLRYALWLYPLAMAFALVYTGEHYVVDVLAGWLYCIAVYAAVEWVAARAPNLRAVRFASFRSSIPQGAAATTDDRSRYAPAD
jgi:membrane-associated phospholipid phosphatase